MRGVAVLLVVACHAVIWYTVMGPGLPERSAAAVSYLGYVGVDLFFVISGFVLSLPLLASPSLRREPGYWRTYFAKRWLRIAPPYYAAMGLVLLMFPAGTGVFAGAKDVFLHLVYLHNLTPQTMYSFSPVFWSLAIEMQFYLILPAFVLLFVGRRWQWALPACAAISLAWGAFAWGPGSLADLQWRSWQLPAFLFHFALGILAARIFVNGWTPTARQWLAGMVASVLIVVGTLWTFIPHPETPWQTWSHTLLANTFERPLVAVGFAGILLLAVVRDSPLRRLLSSAPAVGAGEVSYSVYLLHFPVQVYLLIHLPVVAQHGFLAFFAATTAVVLAASAVYYLLLERPSLWVKNHLAALWARAIQTRRALTAPAPDVASPAPIPRGIGSD